MSGFWSGFVDATAKRPVHFTLLDPERTQPGAAEKLARAADAAGTFAFLVGGSTGVTRDNLGPVVSAVRRASARPVVLFPSSHQQVWPGLDAVLFTSTFNSRQVRNVVEEQALGAELVVGSGIEAVPTAYLVVEPGMTVGRVADVDLITRDDKGLARVRRYAMLARVFGFKAVYLEAGSGAQAAVPPELVRAAAAAGLPVIAGGGVRSPATARALVAAGASAVVTGTVVEQSNGDGLPDIVAAVTGAK